MVIFFFFGNVNNYILNSYAILLAEIRKLSFYITFVVLIWVKMNFLLVYATNNLHMIFDDITIIFTHVVCYLQLS